MFKKIVLDIETTGLHSSGGDKIIEICCLEIKNCGSIINNFHTYINPDKLISNDAFKVHGISNNFLENKPKFFDIVDGFLKFIYNSKIIIHNAEFDLSFINFELKEMGLKKINFYCSKIIDSLKIARFLFPNKRNSLEFLCKRFKIDDNRKFHSAFSDAVLLSKVYLIMIRKLNILRLKKKKYKVDNYNLNYINNIIPKLSRKEFLNHKFFLNKYFN